MKVQRHLVKKNHSTFFNKFGHDTQKAQNNIVYNNKKLKKTIFFAKMDNIVLRKYCVM